jgi:predicted ribosome quality control (RQC) complex YloA/Tae2 family protein
MQVLHHICSRRYLTLSLCRFQRPISTGSSCPDSSIEPLHELKVSVLNSWERKLRKVDAFQANVNKQRDKNHPNLKEETSSTADLIISNLHNWPIKNKGACLNDQILECLDFQTGHPTKITIPAGKSPQQHAEYLYSRARKMRRAQEVLIRLDEEVRQQYKDMDNIRKQIEDIGMNISHDNQDDHDSEIGAADTIRKSIVTLSEIQKKLDPPMQLQPKPKPKHSINRKKNVLVNFLVLEPNDRPWAQLIIGRSSTQNEYVSFKLAQPHHLWFHVRGFPGSHCLLRIEHGYVVSQAELEYAADCAAYHSQARGNSKVEVTYCRAANLRKPKGAPSGTVMITKQEGTVIGRPDRGKLWIEKYKS